MRILSNSDRFAKIRAGAIPGRRQRDHCPRKLDNSFVFVIFGRKSLWKVALF